MTIQVFDPLTGEVVNELTPSANQRLTLAQGPRAYIIRGLYAGDRSARIDLDVVNDPDGLTAETPILERISTSISPPLTGSHIRATSPEPTIGGLLIGVASPQMTEEKP